MQWIVARTKNAVMTGLSEIGGSSQSVHLVLNTKAVILYYLNIEVHSSLVFVRYVVEWLFYLVFIQSEHSNTSILRGLSTLVTHFCKPLPINNISFQQEGPLYKHININQGAKI